MLQRLSCYLQVISPEWNALSDGRYAMSRQGTLLLEFADRLPDASSGVPQGGERRYDWEKKQVRQLTIDCMKTPIAPR